MLSARAANQPVTRKMLLTPDWLHDRLTDEPEEHVDTFFLSMATGIEMKVRMKGWFICTMDSRKIQDLSGPGLLIQTFHISSLTDSKGTVNVNFPEILLSDNLASLLPHSNLGTDKGGQDDLSGMYHQFGYFGDPTDIFLTVLFGKGQIAIDPRPDIVSIQDHDLNPA